MLNIFFNNTVLCVYVSKNVNLHIKFWFWYIQEVCYITQEGKRANTKKKYCQDWVFYCFQL